MYDQHCSYVCQYEQEKSNFSARYQDQINQEPGAIEVTAWSGKDQLSQRHSLSVDNYPPATMNTNTNKKQLY